MEKTFDDILIAALDDLDRGIPAEKILAANPQHANALRPVFATLIALQSARQDVRPAQTLLHDVLTSVPNEQRTQTPAVFGKRLHWFSFAVPMTVLAIVMLSRLDHSGKVPTTPVAVVPATNAQLKNSPADSPINTNAPRTSPGNGTQTPSINTAPSLMNSQTGQATPGITSDVQAALASTTILQSALNDEIESYAADAADLGAMNTNTALDAIDTDLANIITS